MFRDRQHAGQKLGAEVAWRLGSTTPPPIVLALPRGGVPVADHVAQELDAPLDVIVVRKIGAPIHPEYAIGAIAEATPEPVMYLDAAAARSVGASEEEVRAVVSQERRELQRRAAAYRQGRPHLPVAGRVTVVVDDGLATGATARAALMALRTERPARLVLAIPVGAADSVQAMKAPGLADQVICLASPRDFRAVGMWYVHFGQTSDEEVMNILGAYRERQQQEWAAAAATQPPGIAPSTQGVGAAGAAPAAAPAGVRSGAGAAGGDARPQTARAGAAQHSNAAAQQRAMSAPLSGAIRIAIAEAGRARSSTDSGSGGSPVGGAKAPAGERPEGGAEGQLHDKPKHAGAGPPEASAGGAAAPPPLAESFWVQPEATRPQLGWAPAGVALAPAGVALAPAAALRPRQEEVVVRRGAVQLAGTLAVPHGALGCVVFAHGSGSGRRSPRNQAVARTLNKAGCATLLFDLLTLEEADIRANVFDIGLLAGRLLLAVQWLQDEAQLPGTFPLGLFGASTGGAAALWAAAQLGGRVAAVVSRGGRPDLAMPVLSKVTCPVLLLVGGADHHVLQLNRQAAACLGECSLEVVPGASHLFEEPGALEAVAHRAASWFAQHFVAQTTEGEAGAVGAGVGA